MHSRQKPLTSAAARRTRSGIPARGLILLLVLGLTLVSGLTGTHRVLGQDDASDLVGEYSVAFTREELPQDVVNAPSLNGQWRIVFDGDGTYVMERSDVGPLVNGSYTVDGDLVTLTDEGGLLSCVGTISTLGPDVLPDSATYRWESQGDELTLTPEEEGCALRGILLTTRPLLTFIACLTEPFDFDSMEDADAGGTPVAEATSDNPLDELAEEIRQDETPTPDEGDPDAGPEIGSAEDVDAGIDELLSQVTACWSTGDPARLLPLFGADFRAELVDSLGSIEDVADQLAPLLTVPVSFERAGDVEIVDDTNAEAVVVRRLEAEESFSRFTFVFEDGAWRLASLGE